MSIVGDGQTIFFLLYNFLLFAESIIINNDTIIINDWASIFIDINRLLITRIINHYPVVSTLIFIFNY